MKKRLLYLLMFAIFASAAGGLYLYKISADNEQEQTQIVQSSNGGQIDETKISTDPTVFVNSGAAPEFNGLTNWLNTEGPLKIDDLRGKIVLVNFWTYSCIDCTKAIPYISKWDNTYKDQGLVVIGIHTPQYAFEKVAGNIANAVAGLKPTYAIAQDNDYKTWTAYHNQFWPAMYVIDQNGNIVYTHVGGGKYGQTEKAIRTLLGLEGEYEIPPTPAATNPNQTQDMHVGSTKIGSSYGGSEKLSAEEQIFVFPKKLAKNKFALEGSWRQNQESIIHTRGYGRMIMNFNASQLNMIASSPEPVTVKVYVDDILVKGVVVREQGMYQLYDSLTPKDHTVRLEIPNNTLQIMSFTFN